MVTLPRLYPILLVQYRLKSFPEFSCIHGLSSVLNLSRDFFTLDLISSGARSSV